MKSILSRSLALVGLLLSLGLVPLQADDKVLRYGESLSFFDAGLSDLQRNRPAPCVDRSGRHLAGDRESTDSGAFRVNTLVFSTDCQTKSARCPQIRLGAQSD